MPTMSWLQQIYKWKTKIKHIGFVDKSDIAGFINNSDFNKKLATLATKAELKAEQDKIINLTE